MASSNKSTKLVHILSSQLHETARQNGVTARQLFDCGLGDFVNLESHQFGDVRSIAKAALVALSIGSDGKWEGIAPTIIQGIVAFMIDQDFETLNAGSRKSLRTLWTNKGTVAIEDLESGLMRLSRPPIDQAAEGGALPVFAPRNTGRHLPDCKKE